MEEKATSCVQQQATGEEVLLPYPHDHSPASAQTAYSCAVEISARNLGYPPSSPDKPLEYFKNIFMTDDPDVTAEGKADVDKPDTEPEHHFVS
jgi:hypothetical protein